MCVSEKYHAYIDILLVRTYVNTHIQTCIRIRFSSFSRYAAHTKWCLYTCIHTYIHTVAKISSSEKVVSTYIHTYMHACIHIQWPRSAAQRKWCLVHTYIHTYVHTYSGQDQQLSKSGSCDHGVCRHCGHRERRL